MTRFVVSHVNDAPMLPETRANNAGIEHRKDSNSLCMLLWVSIALRSQTILIWARIGLIKTIKSVKKRDLGRRRGHVRVLDEKLH